MDSIEEVLKHKREAEKQIQQICQALEKETGLKINYIYKDKQEEVLGYEIYTIKIKLNLP